MAIGADDLIHVFGTQDAVGSSPASVSNNAISVAGDVSTWTNDDDAPFASFILRCQWSTAPTDGSTIELYGRKLNIQSTSDSPAPSTVNLDQYLATFTVDGDVATSTNAFHVTPIVELPNMKPSQEYDFYILNKSGQTISSSWELWVNPTSLGPHA